MDYVAGGHSYYTAESHVVHLEEAKLGECLTGRLQVLMADEKRLHLFMWIEREGKAVATVEQILLHVDMKAGKTCAASGAVLGRLMPIAAAHAGLARPAAAGRSVGQRKA